MDRRFESRLDEMLDQAEVTPDLVRDLLPRLERFLEPFVATLLETEQKRHTAEYLSGLLSHLEHKTGEGIAYLHDQSRQGLQKFIGLVPWDHQPLLKTLADQVGHELGEPDGVIVNCGPAIVNAINPLFASRAHTRFPANTAWPMKLPLPC